MSNDIDDAHTYDYLEDEFLAGQREEGVDEYKQGLKNDLLDKTEALHANLSITPISKSYKQHTFHAIEHEIWEYASILVWKTVVLSLYEKLYHLNKINKLHQDVKSILESNNQDALSPFSFNCVKDDKIVEKLGLIWRNVDQNFKNMFKALLDERNSLSHVNKYPYTRNKFVAYQEKANDFLDYVQNLHLIHIDELCHQILESEQTLYLSKRELTQLLARFRKNEKVLAYIIALVPDKLVDDDIMAEVIPTAISVFLDSSSYASSYSNGVHLIAPITSYFGEDEYKQLLATNNGQILFSGGMENIYLKLYQESINNFPGIESHWKKFIANLKEGARDQYPRLIELIETE